MARDKITGIYTIQNNIDNKIYVGCANNILSRIDLHISSLKRNCHHNNLLQNAVNKYGIENFKFEILEECSSEFLYSMENYWCNLLNSHNKNNGYNLKNTNPFGKVFRNKGYKHSTETKNKISKNNSIRIISDNCRLNMSKSAKERVKRMGTNLKNLTPQQIQKAAISRGKPILKYSLNGLFIKEYGSLKEAAEDNNTNSSTIRQNCIGLSKKCRGYVFKYKNQTNLEKFVNG